MSVAAAQNFLNVSILNPIIQFSNSNISLPGKLKIVAVTILFAGAVSYLAKKIQKRLEAPVFLISGLYVFNRISVAPLSSGLNSAQQEELFSLISALFKTIINDLKVLWP